MSDDFTGRVTAIVAGLDVGEVATYGEIADQAGRPGAARAVGAVLRRSSGLPWWRVVASSGRLVPGKEQEHARRLRSEGVALTAGGRVAAR
ncbi:MAG: MGMT family protein [Acidimicrobiia bacterium]|nr:MGMT family protein [Acidimicrobiia bacterium]